MSNTYIDISTGSRYFYTGSFSPPGGANTLLNFKSVKQLYYSSFNTSSGYVEQSSSFDNFIESSLATGSRIMENSGEGLAFSIPQQYYGNNLLPSSITVKDSTYTLVDDGEGNLLTGSSKIGNVIYTHGLIIVNDETLYNHYSSSAGLGNFPDISFKSDNTVYTNTFSIKISDYEFNHTLNPTAQSGSTILEYSGSKYLQPSGVYRPSVTGSEFQPYITTVGLYNDSNDLIAVGKLAQPLPKPADTELTININLDI